jgi:hypothetical protein
LLGGPDGGEEVDRQPVPLSSLAKLREMTGASIVEH